MNCIWTQVLWMNYLKNYIMNLSNHCLLPLHLERTLRIKRFHIQLELLSSNKNHFVLLFSKNNYNVNEQTAWITWNEWTNLEILSQYQSQSQTVTIKESYIVIVQSMNSNQSKFINSSSEFFSDQVWVFNEEIQQQWTTELCLKYEENNYRVMICFKDWTFFELNQNSRTISVTNLNQDQLKSHQKKEFSSANILALLNI